MALFFHSIASLVMAECACASLIFTSFTDVPSLVCVEPKHLNWYTSSSVCLFTCMLVDGLDLMLLTRILVSSELVSIISSTKQNQVHQVQIVNSFYIFLLFQSWSHMIFKVISRRKDNIKEWTGRSMSSLLHITNDKDRWAVIASDVGVPHQRQSVMCIC